MKDVLIQATLDGGEAERVECEYYDGCKGAALYIAEILHYGEGEKPVKMCESCAEEHTEIEGNEVQRIKPEDRYVTEAAFKPTVYVVVTRYDGDPHPHVEGVYRDKADAEEVMERCRDRFKQPHPIAWELVEQEVET